MHRSRSRRLVMVACGFAVAATVIGTASLVLCGLYESIGRADVALVLGSKVDHGGAPSPRLRARLDRTVELYEAGYFPQIIVSGGVGREGYDEASVMRDYLIAHSIPRDRVIVDSAGTTTFLSAEHTSAIARDKKFSSVFVVSQYFHIPRTRLALRRFGVATVYSAYARFFEARDAFSSPRELVGYLRYFFRHYDRRDGEAAPGAR